MDNYKISLPASVLLPVVIVFLSVQLTYIFNIRSSLVLVESIYTIMAAVCGAYFFKNIQFKTKSISIVSWVVYVIVLVFLVFWVSLLTACGNGDCL